MKESTLNARELESVILDASVNKDNWGFCERLAYRRPFERFLIGILVETGKYGGTRVHQVIAPLFIPFDGVVLDWSDSIRYGHFFKQDESQELVNDISNSYIFDIDEEYALNTVINRAKQGGFSKGTSSDFFTPKGEQNIIEVAGYALILQGKLEAAQHVLSFALYDDAIFPWQFQHNERVVKILSLMDESKEKTIAQLDEWCAHTKNALKMQ